MSVIVDERETYSYDDQTEANLHDKLMCACGWMRTEVYKHEGKIYQSFNRKRYTTQ
jgi:hypothetical protein